MAEAPYDFDSMSREELVQALQNGAVTPGAVAGADGSAPERENRVKLFRLHERNQSWRQYSRALLMENKWRAARYGIQGKLIDFGQERERPEKELILEYLEWVDDVLDELGSRKAVSYIHWILEHGTGADRQLAVYNESGQNLKAVINFMAQETKMGLE